MKVGGRTPWGGADHVNEVVRGVFAVSTPGHGGLKLDRVRNAKVPAATRQKGGFYEEDCEVFIVFAVHKDVARHFGVDLDDVALNLARWLPQSYVLLRDAAFVRATAKSEAILAEEHKLAPTP